MNHGSLSLLHGLREGYCLRMPEELRSFLSEVYPRARLLANSSHLNPYRDYIAVGDTVTRSLISLGYRPRLLIFDCMEKRTPISCPEIPSIYNTLSVSNPRSCITFEAMISIKNGLAANRPIALRVYGEEDLLVLPVVIFAPIEAVILYGQPNKGLVYLEVDRESKQLALRLMSFFDIEKYR